MYMFANLPAGAIVLHDIVSRVLTKCHVYVFDVFNLGLGITFWSCGTK